MSVVRGRLPARSVPIAPASEGESWTMRHCPACERRRMMPDGETTCLHCQMGKPRRVFPLPNLRAIREQAGLTREDLEETVGISQYRLHLIEVGDKRVAAKTARRIAAALGTTVDALSAATPTAVALQTTTAAKLATRDGTGAA